MADVKISALPASTTPLAGTEVLPIVQSGVTKQVSVDNLTAGKAVSADSLTLTGGTANGVVYLNGSKVVTTGSNLTFDGGSNLTISRPSGVGNTQLTFTNNGAGASGFMLGQGAQTQNFFIYDVAAAANRYNILSDGTQIWSGASELMRLTSTGLGIGTSSPGAKFESYQSTATLGGWAMSGQLSAANYPMLNLAATSSNKIARIGNNGDGSFQLFVNGSNVALGTLAATLDSSGNLGLGVTPSAWGSGEKAIELGGTNQSSISGNLAMTVANGAYFNGTSWIYKSTGVAPALYQQTYGGGHIWKTASPGTAGNAISFTQAMTLDESGNLLVGTTTTGFQNNQSVTVQGPAGYVLCNHVSGTGSGAVYAGFGYAGGAIGSITQNGTTGVLYNIISDYRLKTFVSQVSGSGERIDALNPVEFEWKADGRRSRGFFAHEFASVYADSVAGEKDAVDEEGKPVYQQMQASTNEVIADLVAELKSLRARVAQLEGK